MCDVDIVCCAREARVVCVYSVFGVGWCECHAECMRDLCRVSGVKLVLCGM